MQIMALLDALRLPLSIRYFYPTIIRSMHKADYKNTAMTRSSIVSSYIPQLCLDFQAKDRILTRTRAVHRLPLREGPQSPSDARRLDRWEALNNDVAIGRGIVQGVRPIAISTSTRGGACRYSSFVRGVGEAGYGRHRAEFSIVRL